jgi:hypothetical protein
MCYILCMIVGPPIRGFRGEAPQKKKFLGVIHQIFGRFFTFGGGGFFTFGRFSGAWYFSPWFSNSG